MQPRASQYEGADCDLGGTVLVFEPPSTAADKALGRRSAIGKSTIGEDAR
jgi:hypothetical protein